MSDDVDVVRRFFLIEKDRNARTALWLYMLDYCDYHAKTKDRKSRSKKWRNELGVIALFIFFWWLFDTPFEKSNLFVLFVGYLIRIEIGRELEWRSLELLERGRKQQYGQALLSGVPDSVLSTVSARIKEDCDYYSTNETELTKLHKEIHQSIWVNAGFGNELSETSF